MIRIELEKSEIKTLYHLLMICNEKPVDHLRLKKIQKKLAPHYWRIINK